MFLETQFLSPEKNTLASDLVPDVPLPGQWSSADDHVPPRFADGAKPDGHGSLVLDLEGTIRFCSTALSRCVGEAGLEVVGKHVTSLLPDLPLRCDTPGYNIAVSIMLSARPDRPFRLMLRDGGTIGVLASVHHFITDHRRLFVLDLCWKRASPP